MSHKEQHSDHLNAICFEPLAWVLDLGLRSAGDAIHNGAYGFATPFFYANTYQLDTLVSALV